jgi:hypothetical protein
MPNSTDLTIFDNGEIKQCPRCGGPIKSIGQRMGGKVTLFECVGTGPFPHDKPCGLGDALRARRNSKEWTVYWDNDALMGWSIRNDEKPWGENSPRW